MTARFATEAEMATWNETLLRNPDGGNFFQTLEFAHIKQAYGWQPLYVVTDTTIVLILQKKIRSLGNLWYIPKGPGVSTAEELQTIMDDLKMLATENKVFTIKIEPELQTTSVSQAQLSSQGLVRATNAQPTFSTIFVDISPDLEHILASFDGKVRYNIRQAEKAGVTCREVEATDENCKLFYDMFTETASGRFGIRPYDYYKLFWQTYCRAGQGKIVFAYLGDDVVSADFLMILGTKGSRKDAASPRQKPVRGAAAILELEAIRLLKEVGVTSYDLCGSPPAAHLKDQSHPLYGIGQFKSGFSQDVVDFIGTYELALKPLQAKAWQKIVERVVKRLHYRQHHYSYY